LEILQCAGLLGLLLDEAAGLLAYRVLEAYFIQEQIELAK